MRVEAYAETERVLFEGRRAVGVAYRKGGALVEARARGEVILAAGAIGSPKILQLSGVGPGALLAEHGIGVLHEAPGVGENLQDHLQIRCAWKVTGAVTLAEGALYKWEYQDGVGDLVALKGADGTLTGVGSVRRLGGAVPFGDPSCLNRSWSPRTSGPRSVCA